jgi:hypothetical protein
MPDPIREQRKRVLTDLDLEAISARMACSQCSFTSEEVQFVKDWLDTAKTAKSEVIKWIVKGIIILIGLVAGLQVAIKMGFGKGLGK